MEGATFRREAERRASRRSPTRPAGAPLLRPWALPAVILAAVVAVLAGCKADWVTNPNAAAVWGPLDCQRQGTWRPDWWKNPVAPQSYRWFSSGGPANEPYRRLTVVDGYGGRGERCQLGFNDWGKHWGTDGSFQVYHEGDHSVTAFWLRFPDNFRLNTSAWQIVAEMKQAEPAMSAGGPPVLALYAYHGRFHLLHYGRREHPLWTSGPIKRNAWIGVVANVRYSQHPAKGSVRIHADVNGDGSGRDAGEGSRRIQIDTLKRETESGGPIPRGRSIPSVLRIGTYHDRSIPCPDGCSLDVGPVGVHPIPPSPNPNPGPCTEDTFSPSNEPGACWRPYSNSSPWNTPIPAGTPSQSDSARLVANLGSVAAGQSKFGDPDLETSNQPVYWSVASGKNADPGVTVECTDYGGACPVEGLQVPLVPGASPAGGFQGPGTYNDANMIVVNATNGREYDFWRVQSRSGGVLRIGWGGHTNVTGLGDAASNLGSGSSASGSDLPELGGTITGEELAANRIPHALRLVVPCGGSHVYPAGKNAGPSCGSDSIPMGTRFQLTMSDAEIDALPAPGWQKAVLHAFHTYGAYAADVSGTGARSWWSVEWSGCDMYESIGDPCKFVQYAKQQGIAAQNFDHDGELEYQFRWWKGIDWARSVRVVPPPAH